MPEPGGVGPPLGTLPCEVFIALNPHNAAGILIDPPPSDQVVIGTMPAAKAADDPPDDPPGVNSLFQGFFEAPKGTLSVTPL